ncbi:MAG: nickel pincer cofactor biosynthesis protein LarC, partial [Spirochaetota bacterium]
MKILYYDPFAGISGDMNLGALLNLGIASSYLLNELAKLNLKEKYNIKITGDVRRGIAGTRVEIILTGSGHHTHPQEHRHLDDIRNIIERSALHEQVKKTCLEIFTRLAAAESTVHGLPLNEIHFHEVGAVDAIIDIAGAAICLHRLKEMYSIKKIISAPVELGVGFVKCTHGILPVPAPAVVELLKNVPVKTGAVQSETTTPTGAAILSTVVQEFNASLHFTIEKTGYGVGSRDTEIPNVLRVFIGELVQPEVDDFETSEAFVIDCNIDDMNPEFYESVIEKLFEGGASDAFITPIIMKKSRPAVT